MTCIEEEDEMYLSDSQYLSLLQTIKEAINTPNFKPIWYDCTDIGDKSTQTNCGLCNDNFTTKDMAMFPNEFPERKDMKYPKEYHKCPFDYRKKQSLNGCFYTCWFFKRHLTDINKIQDLVEQQIMIGINNPLKIKN